jgi:hypothetical protein
MMMVNDDGYYIWLMMVKMAKLGYNPYGPMLINGIYIIMIYLVGGAITILKNMSSSMGRIIPIYYGK